MPKKANPTYNLAVCSPELLKLWSPKNTVSPYEVTPKARLKVLWICDCGNEWEAQISHVGRGSRCKLCAVRRAAPENTFAARFPDKVKMWSTKNEFGPDTVSYKSGRRAWWKCDQEHEWNAIISSVANGTGCPYCANLKITPDRSFAAIHPNRAKCWDYTKNLNTLPDEIAPATSNQYWFVCEEKHSFQMAINNIHSRDSWCPFCAGQKATPDNNLQIGSPTLAAEWHPTKNTSSPTEFLPQSNQKVWWICEQGHEWLAQINSRYRGNGCPKCSNRDLSATNNLWHQFPEIAAQYDTQKNIVSDPKLILAGSHQRVWWICDYGHHWQTSVRNRTGVAKTGCPKCSPQSSFPEIRVFCELKHLFEPIEHRAKIDDIEVDILFPTLRLAIEFDGSYFHKSKLEADKRKSAALISKGFSMVRLRVSPLGKLSANDLIIPNEPNLSIETMTKIVHHLCEIEPKLSEHLKNYSREKAFVNDSEYRDFISFLPGPGPKDSLAAKNPEIAKEWHPEKNKPLVPEMFHPRSGKKVWWICEKNHEWEATIDHRAVGRGCPVCSGKKVHPDNSLATLDPEIASLWYQPQNNLTPHEVTLNSGKKAWFKCPAGHFTYTAVASKVSSRGCAHCPGIGRNKKYTPPPFARGEKNNCP